MYRTISVDLGNSMVDESIDLAGFILIVLISECYEKYLYEEEMLLRELWSDPHSGCVYLFLIFVTCFQGAQDSSDLRVIFKISLGSKFNWKFY